MKRCTRLSLGLLFTFSAVVIAVDAGPAVSGANCKTQVAASSTDILPRIDFKLYMEQRGPNDPDPTAHMRELIEYTKANRRTALVYCARQQPPIAPKACSGGVPFCALIVDRKTDRVVAKACNHGSANPIFHGEIAAIIDFATNLQGQGIAFRKVAGHHDIYTTGESCAMCMGAIMWSGFHTVFFGSSVEHLNKYFSQIMISDHDLSGLWRGCQAAENVVRTQIVGGVLLAQNNELFEEFGFQFCQTPAIGNLDNGPEIFNEASASRRANKLEYESQN